MHRDTTRGAISVKGAVLTAFITVIACFAMLAGASNANAAFTITDFDMSPVAPASNSSALQAGGHPTVNFRINPDAVSADSSGDDLKKVVYEFPAGSLGNPEAALPKCTATQFNADQCPASSYIGSLSMKLRIKPLFRYKTLVAHGSMYILDPATPGSAVTVGFIVRPRGYRHIFLKSEVKGVVSVRSGLDADYGLDFTVDNIPKTLQTTWGSSLNATISDLTVVLNWKTGTSVNGGFFTYAPTRCDVSKVRATLTSHKTTTAAVVKNDSYATTGCASVPFRPTAAVQPSTFDVNQPANWTADFSVPTAPANIQDSHIRSISVDLPPSTQLNYTELAAITTVCSEAQINADDCPASSKIGTVSAHVPILPGSSPNFTGDVFILSKTSGVTFGYIVRGPNGVKAQIRGWIQPVDTDGVGGSDRIRAYSENMPQAPFSPANISFTRPMVLNPVSCGSHPVKTTITGWSGASWTQTVNQNYVCTGPQTPETAITSSVPSPTNDNTPTFNFSATPAADATFEVSVDSGAFVFAGGSSYTPAALSEGSHTFRVRACNSAATTPCDATPAAQTFVVDTIAPSLTIGSPSPGALLNSTAVGVSFFSSDSSATFRCKLDSNADAACTSPANYTSLSQGSHSVEVVARDAAGNSTTRTVTFTVDSQAPTATANCAANSPVDQSATCAFTFNEPVSNVTCTSSAGATDTSCVSPKIYSGLADGTYTFSVSGTDVAGNVGTAVAANFTISIDTTGPVTTINSGPSGLQSSRTAMFTFSANEAATFYCSLDSAPATACSSGVSYSSLVDGPHTFAVYGIDSSSNQGATVTRNFSVDGTAPASPTLARTAPTSTPTSSTTAILTVSGVEAGGTVQYSSNGGTTWTTGANPLNLSSLTNGTTYTYIARVQDAAGNNSAASNSVTWTVDTAAPATPTLTRTAPTSSPTTSQTATLTPGNVEAGGTVEYSSNGGATWAVGANPLSLSALADGSYSYTARVRDAAGNVSAASNAVTWTVDTLAPTAPTVTRTSPTADPTSSTTQAISIAGVEAGGTLACALDSVAYTPCTTSIGLSGLGSGSHTFAVTVRDAAGNISAPGQVTWTVDSSGVNAPTISAGPTAGSFVSSTSASFTFASTTPSVTYECHIDAAAYSACTSPQAYSSLTQGSHTFYVRARNGVGTYSSETTRQWTVDTVAPAVPTLTRTAPTSTPTNSTNATLTLTGVEAGAVTEYSSNGGTTWASGANPLSLTGLTNGTTYTYIARVQDVAGNNSAASNSVTWTVDTTAPGLPTVTRTNPTATPTSSTTQDISISGLEAGASVTCTLDGVAYTPCAAGTVSLSGLTSAVHTFAVTQIDAAGNVGSAASVAWEVIGGAINAPTITAGPAAGGFVSSTSASFTFASSTSGVTYECHLDAAAYSACTSPQAYSSLTQGSHTFYVRARNTVGTYSSETTRQWTVDTVLPVNPGISLDSPTSSPTQSPNASISFTGEAGATFFGRLDAASFAVVSSPVALSSLADGSHTYSVYQVDQAGNTSGTVQVAWVVDNAIPATPTLTRTAPAGALTNSTTATLTTGNVEAGGIVQYSSNGGTTWTTGTNPLSLTGLTNGSYSYIARVQDAAGNNSAASNAVTWTVDTIAPAAPTVTGPSGTTALQTATITFTGEAGATFGCSLDGGASPTFTPCTNPVNLSGLTNGPHTYDVRQTDAAGNVGPAQRITWTVDTSAFTAQILTGPSGTIAATSASFTYTATILSGTTFECGNVVGTSAPTTFTTCANAGITYSSLVNGTTYTFAVRAVNGAQTSPAVPRTYTIDTAPPTVTPTNPGTTGPSGSIAFTATDATSPVTTTCQLDGAAFVACSGSFAFSGLASGSHTLNIRAQDGVGNFATTPVVWTVDATPPNTTISGPSGVRAVTTETITFTSTESPSTFECNVDGGGYVSCTSPLILNSLAQGSHNVSVRATDQYGNTDASPATAVWSVDSIAPATPTLARTSPASTPTNQTTATLTPSGVEAGGIVQYSSNGGTTWTTGTNPLSLSGLTNGTSYTYIARVQDAAGNNSAASNSVTWTVDTAAPAAPTLTRTSPTSTPTNQTTATLTPSGVEAGGIVQYSSNGGTTWTTGANPLSLSGLTNGTTYTYIARVQDAAGNNSAASNSVTWTV
ncbi:MAG: hypothetical protein ACSLFF_05055, partial [Solirubrobacterales bacterium]